MNGEASGAIPRAAGQHARAEGLRLSFRVVVISVVALIAMFLAWLVLKLPTWPVVGIELAAIGVMVAADRAYTPDLTTGFRAPPASERWAMSSTALPTVAG